MTAAEKRAAQHAGADAGQQRAEYVASLVAAAPPLSAATADRLAVLLRPATRGRAAR